MGMPTKGYLDWINLGGRSTLLPDQKKSGAGGEHSLPSAT